MRTLLILCAFFFSSISFASLQKAIFAGGCFWCMESPFEKLHGVKSVVSGFSGGSIASPSYQSVASGETKHREVIEVSYDSDLISYVDLLEVFWRQINPTDPDGQFVDRGYQYSSAIYYLNESQKKVAEQSKKKLSESKRFQGKKIVTPILEAKPFYAAEEYHQDYYKKSALKYKFYRYRSGRDQYLDKTWGSDREYIPNRKKKMTYSKPSRDKLKKILTPLQFKVTQKDGTERAFNNEYWDNKKKGIYVDIVSGEPLFSSIDKYDSKTGWPSFTKPIDEEFIVTKKDRKLFMTRIEVRSKYGDSHLGHVFEDGPAPTGLRYCINSASLRFIALEDLEKEGYGQYTSLFK